MKFTDKFLKMFGALGMVVILLGLAGGTTHLAGLVVIEDAAGSPPTCSVATVAGELCIEGDAEVVANLEVDGTTTLTGATAITGALTVTGALSSPELKVAEVAISLAEMIGLRATNKTLVAAQGANTVIIPERVVFFLNYGSAVFTESADNLALNYVGAAGDLACTAFETTASWLVAGADAYGSYSCDLNLTSTVAEAVNTALTLDNTGDGEFGDGTGSTVTAWIYYRVVDVS